MKTTLIGIASATIVLLASAGLAWSGGYNFDHRDMAVADGVFTAVFCATFAGILVPLAFKK